MHVLVLAAQEAPPAGGSALGEVVAASAVGLPRWPRSWPSAVVHRRRRVLAPIARLIERQSG